MRPIALASRSTAALTIAVAALGATASGAAASPTFVGVAATMHEARYEPIAATLPDGNALIAGGYNSTGGQLKTAELFKPETGTFEALTAQLVEPREEAAHVTLPSGQILLIGGAKGGTELLRTLEVYEPVAGTFTKLTAEMAVPRQGPAATVLGNGKVLIVGGYNQIEAGAAGYLESAELYDPGTNSFEAVAWTMHERRYAPAIAPLPDGKVLIAGGYNSEHKYLKNAELFNPPAGPFEDLPAQLAVNRDEMAYTALEDGAALIAGGYSQLEAGAGAANNLNSAEVFNPTTNSFDGLAAQMTTRRDGPAAALLYRGRVLIVGGYNAEGTDLNTAEESVPGATVTTGAATAVGTTGATLNGTVLAEAIGTGYFEYGTGTGYGTSTPHQLVPASLFESPVAATLTGLSPATTYHFRFVAESAGGPAYGPEQTFTTSLSLPCHGCGGPRPGLKISQAHQAHSRWREGSKLAKISAKGHKKPPVGTTFSFSLNERAAVTFRFTDKVSGRRAGRRCVAKTHRNAKKKSCKRTVTAGKLTFTGHAGTNRVVFQGRISRSKKLPRGRYTLVIEATDSSGHAAPVRLSFTIVR